MKNIMRNEQGGVLILVAISLMVLFLAGSVAIDMSRFQTARAKFSTCLDNAGLAALSKIKTQSAATVASFAVTTADNYYQANCASGFSNTAPVHITSGNLSLSDGNNTITIDLSTPMPTTLINIIGINTLTLNGHSVVARANENGLELAMVLDNTGSMKLQPDATLGVPSGTTVCKNTATSTAFSTSVQGSRMCALQVASENLINVLFGVGNPTAPPNMWISIVPFAQAVNIGGIDATACGGLGYPCTKATTPSYSDNFSMPFNQMIASTTLTTATQTSSSQNIDYGPVSGAAAAWTDCPSHDINGNALVVAQSGPASGNTPAHCAYQTTDPINKPVTFGLQNWNGCVEQRPNHYRGPDNSGPLDTIDVPPGLGGAVGFPVYFSPASKTFTQTASGIPLGVSGIGLTFNWTADSSGGGIYPAGFASNNETFNIDPGPSYPDANNLSGGLNELFTQLTPSPVTALNYSNLSKTYAQALVNNWKVVSLVDNTTTYYLPLINSVPSGSASIPQGPNAYCTSPLTPMTNSRDTLMNAVKSMYPNGQTILASGMNWGLNMLSPDFNGVWGGAMASNNLPKPYNTTGNIKAVVFMTDGYDFFYPGSYTAYGTLADGELVGTNNKLSTNGDIVYDESSADAELDMRFFTNCQELIQDNVDVFTVGFGQTDNINVPDVSSGAAPVANPDVNGPLLQSCASIPKNYFFASDAASLNEKFNEIAQLLSNLRVAQ